MTANVTAVKLQGGAGYIRYLLDQHEEVPYHLRETKAPHQFGGEGAWLWGLSGQTIQPGNLALHRMMKGYHPETETPLTRRVESQAKTYTAALDLTLSAPKDFSALQALADATGNTSLSQKLEQSHDRAVKATLAHVEEKLLFSRLDAQGTRLERVKGVFALIHHGLSRPSQAGALPDPQRHTHVLIMNAGILPDGTTRALDASPLFKSQHRLGQIYRDVLQQQLETTLGIQCRSVPLKRGRSFEIPGIPRSLIKDLSQRRQTIEQSTTGRETPAQRQAIVLKTRQPKPQQLDFQQLQQHWLQTAKVHGFDLKQWYCTVQQKTVQPKSEWVRTSTPAQTNPTIKNTPVVNTPQPASTPLIQAIQDRKTTQSVKSPPVALTAKSPTADFSAYPDIAPAPVLPLSQRIRQHPSSVRQHWIQKREAIKTPVLDSRTIQQKQPALRWSYATGHLSRSIYQRLQQGKPLPQPKRKWAIDWAYATYQLSQAQRVYLYQKHGHGLPKGIPTSKLGLHIAHLTGQITARQKLYLLHRHHRTPQPRPLSTLSRFPQRSALTQPQRSVLSRAKERLQQWRQPQPQTQTQRSHTPLTL